MKQTWVRDYVERYLNFHNCNFIERGLGHTQVKLSVDVDKDLANRPYYWAFVERTGAEPETLTMTFIFDKEQVTMEIRGEELYFGSERLKQFFRAAKNRGKIVRLYQQFSTGLFTNKYNKSYQTRTLNPWLGVNFKVEFLSDKKKDKLISLGMNLVNGRLQVDFFKKLQKLNLGPVLPANVLTAPPFITFRESALQLEEFLMHEIHQEDFAWAISAYDRLAQEIEQLEAYYYQHQTIEEKDNQIDNSSIEDTTVEKEKRIEEVSWLYSPRVEVMPINYGIFYLDETVLKNVEYLN